MKHRRQLESKGALEWIEEATHLLRTSPVSVLAIYYIGSLPFVLGLLYFWADMSRSPFAKDHVIEAALALALAYLWMKTWQSIFCLRLRAIVAGDAMEPMTFRRCVRIFAAQTAIQPPGLLLVPLALVTVAPFALVFGFYQSATAIAEPGAAEDQSLFKRSLAAARSCAKRNYVTLIVLALFAAFVFLNWSMACAMLPGLIKTLLGIESSFARSTSALLNTTFFATMAGLTYLSVDPVVKALHVLRCFRSEAQTTGDDLKAELRHIAAAGRVAAMVIVVMMSFSASGAAGKSGSDPALRSTLPHPGPLPLGEGTAVARFSTLRTVHRQSQSQVFAEDGARFSLSQRERAGVREQMLINTTASEQVEAAEAPVVQPATPPAASPAAVPPQQLNRSIEEVINQQKYTWRMPRENVEKKPETAEEGAISRFFSKIRNKLGEWGQAVLDWLSKLSKDRAAPRASPNGSGGINPGFAAGSKLLLYALLVLAIAALFYLAYRIWQNRRRGAEVIEAAPIQVVPDIRDENVTAEQLPEDEWTRLGRELLAKGEFRLAMRAFYLSSLAYLGERRLITLARFKSNREYERELARRGHVLGDLLATFGENVVAIDRVWYGSHAADADAVNHFAANVQKIRTTA